MLIDWFTVIAQVINFLILVWLLKRFLYRPILDAIDAREKRIAAKITDADAKETEAQKQREEYEQKNKLFDQQRNTRMNEMLESAKSERAKLLDAARQESDDLRARLQQALRNEQRSLNEELSRRASEEVYAIARKTLADLAATTLEERMTEIFLRRLRELNDSQMAEVKSAFKSATNPLFVRTAFTLPPEQCLAIEKGIKEKFGKEKIVKFQTAPDLISGIEMNADGQKIAWSIAEYLASLGKSVDDLLRKPKKIQSRLEASNQSSSEQSTNKSTENHGA
jgi:F-type H+-transporting ATPase subunit b